MMRQLLRKTIGFVTEHNRITLLLMILLTGVFVAGIPQLDMASDAGGSADEFDDNQRVQTQQYIDDQYINATEAQSNRTFRTVYVWEEDVDVLSKESLLSGLRYQQQITGSEAIQAALHDDGIVGIENLVATRAAGNANASLDEQERALENASVAEVNQLVDQVLSEDPRAQRFLPADHDGPASSTDRRMLVAFDTEVESTVRSNADTVLYEVAQEYESAGIFVINADAWEEASQHFFGEMVELVLPIALLVILSVLVFTYRDFVDVVVGMTGVVFSVLWMFGLLGWLGVQAGVISIVPVVLISGLSIDFGFHIFNRYREQRGHDEGIREPMNRGVRLVTTALVLVTITASIGFMANVVNPLSMIQDLGVSITLGVISALVIFVTFVPALKISIDGLLERVGVDRRKTALGHGSYLRPLLEGSVTLARRAAPAILLVAVLVAGLGGFAWMDLNEESFQQSDGEIAEWKQKLPGPLGWEQSDVPEQDQHVQEVYQPANTDDAIRGQLLVRDNLTHDNTLEDINAGVQQINRDGLLVTQSGLQAERSPATEMRAVASDNETFAAILQNADTNGNGIPDQNLEAVYDAFYAADSQAAERVLERQDGEYRSILVTVLLDTDFSEGSNVVSTLDDSAATMATADDRTANAAGSIVINNAILNEIVDGIVVTMIVALIAISVAMTVVFRYMHGSATLGAVVSLPIMLVVGLVIGGMYLLGIPLTLLTALLMSLVIGLGVDYNIHIGDRFADELDAGKTPIEALQLAVTGTGGALLGSTLTSAGAFASIALVPHPQMQSFGAIVVIALVTSFLVSLLVLPSLLLLWSRYDHGIMTVEQEATEPTIQD